VVLCTIQFDQICASSGTHRCYHHSDELSLYVVIHQVPSRVLYTPWSVIYSSLGASHGRDTRLLVICDGEELRPEDCALWERADSAGNVRVL